MRQISDTKRAFLNYRASTRTFVEEIYITHGGEVIPLNEHIVGYLPLHLSVVPDGNKWMVIHDDQANSQS